MQTRREQVHAHLFMTGRLTSGVLGGEPDAPETPLARTVRGLAVGLALALLIVAVFAGYGLLTPGSSTSWKNPKTLIVVSETGARYLYLDGVLHPVRNYASAVLLFGGGVTVKQVPVGALAGVTRGSTVGIDGAPESLPAASALASTGTWQACAARSADGAALTTARVDPPDPPTTVDTSKAVLIASAGGRSYLLWNGKRLLLPADHATLAALGYDGGSPLTVSASFLAAVPAGSDLVAPAVAGRGRPGPRLGGLPTVVGQLFVVRSTVDQYYLLQSDGLVPVGTTVYDLLRADPNTGREAYGGGGVKVAALDPGDLNGKVSALRSPAAVPADWPPEPPLSVPVADGAAVCELVRVSASAPVFLDSIVDGSSVTGTQVATGPGCAADRVWVVPGGGVLVRALDGDSASITYLVTDTGSRYPVSDGGLSAFGYSQVAAQRVPVGVLAMLPAGPPLDAASVQTGIAGVRRC